MSACDVKTGVTRHSDLRHLRPAPPESLEMSVLSRVLLTFAEESLWWRCFFLQHSPLATLPSILRSRVALELENLPWGPAPANRHAVENIL
jgi:hypothetical protein